MTPSEALQHIVTLVEASAKLKATLSARYCYVALSWSPRRVSAWRRMA